eukprot:130290-Hanusia_phi.AAC.4
MRAEPRWLSSSSKRSGLPMMIRPGLARDLRVARLSEHRTVTPGGPPGGRRRAAPGPQLSDRTLEFPA